MIKAILAASGIALMVSGCALFQDTGLTKDQCRARSDFWEFNYADYLDALNGVQNDALGKFTWHDGLCEYVTDKTDSGDDSGDSDSGESDSGSGDSGSGDSGSGDSGSGDSGSGDSGQGGEGESCDK